MALLAVATTATTLGTAPSAGGLAFGEVVAPAAGWEVTSRRAVPPGVEILELRREEPLGRARVAIVDRSELWRLRVVLSNEQLVEETGRRERTSAMCARLHCHVAINGDHWVQQGPETSRPVGPLFTNGELVATAPIGNPWAHFLLGHDGTLTSGDGPLPLAPVVTSPSGQQLPLAVNRQIPTEGVSVFTGRYGPSTLTPPDVVEYELAVVGDDETGRVLAPLARREGGSSPIAPTSIVVAARGTAIAQAEAWWADVVDGGGARYTPTGGAVREGSGAQLELIEDGRYAFPPDSGSRDPRSLVGWDDGRLFLVTIDGRQTGWSVGATHVESAQVMRWLGATQALSLDGGGSATFVEGSRVRNRVSDRSANGVAVERYVASGLVIGPPEGWQFGTPSARPVDPACPPGRVPASSFTDVAAGSVHRPSIDCVTWWQVASGTSASTYVPDEPVTRGQMATFLTRLVLASGALPPVGAPDAFDDDDGSVHEDTINAMVAAGVVAGRPDGTFGPDEPVSRGQMATFLSRTWHFRAAAPLTHTLDFFGDDGGHTHETAINDTATAGIVTGLTSGGYGPDNRVSRGQMATFLARLLATLVENGIAAPKA